MARPLRAELHSQRANCPLRRPAQLTDSQARTVKQLLHRILQSSYIGSFPPNRAFNGRRGFAARVNWFVAHAALRTRVAERSSCAKFARTSASATGGQTELRSEEHTSELQSLMRISYAVFCLKKTKKKNNQSRMNKVKIK